MPRLNASQSTRVFTWKAKPTINFSIIPPVRNQWYTILNVIAGCKLYTLRVYHVNDLTIDQDVELEITIDDLAVGGGSNTLASSVDHFFYAPPLTLMPDQYQTPASCLVGNLVAPIEFTNVLIRARITSVLGANPELQVDVVYETLEQI